MKESEYFLKMKCPSEISLYLDIMNTFIEMCFNLLISYSKKSFKKAPIKSVCIKSDLLNSFAVYMYIVSDHPMTIYFESSQKGAFWPNAKL